MSETVITKIIDIQTSKAIKNIDDLKKEINSLKNQLSSLDKTSVEYTKTLDRLNQYESQLNNVNKVSQQNTQKLANQLSSLSRIGSGLAGGFSALNGVLALLGKSGDDLSKVMVKLQSGIAIVQGIGGLEGLARSLPQIKGWFDNLKNSVVGLFSNLDPFNRRITESAQALNNLDIQPIKELANIGNVNISANVSGGSKEVQQTTQALQQQQRTIVPVNEQWNKYIANQKERLAELNKQKTAQNNVLNAAKAQQQTAQQNVNTLSQQVAQYQQLQKYAQILINQYGPQAQQLAQQIQQQLKQQYPNIQLPKNALQNMEALNTQLQSAQQNLDKATQAAAQAQKAVSDISAEISNTEKAIQKAEFAQTKLGKAWGVFKSIGLTVVWTALITAITAAVFKLVEWVTALNKAANAQREFDKAINKTTSDIAGNGLAAFNELLNVYDKFSDKSEFLKEYGEQIKQTGLKINDVKDAEDAFINNTDKYKAAIIARAQLDAYRQTLSEKTKEYINTQLEIERAGAERLNEAIKEAGLYASGADVSTIKIANAAQVEKELNKSEKEYNDFVNNITNKTEKLRSTWSHLWADEKEVVKETVDQGLEEWNKYLDESSKLYFTDQENAINALNEKYDRLYSIAQQKGFDLNQLEETYLIEKEAILNKYLDREVKTTEEKGKTAYEKFKEELARIRQLSDTSNLGEVNSDKYQTRYTQWASTLVGAPGEVFTYQSKDDVNREYQAEIERNNKVYELTKQRIEAENQLLLDQLSNDELTADQRLEIKRILNENMIALDDAYVANESNNGKALDKVYAKRRQALQATLQVASSVMGSLASIAQTEYNNEQNSEEQRKKAFTTYKVAATAQAIMDTYAAANSSYQAMASIPYVGPFLGAAAAAAAIAAGVANVVQIQKTQFSSNSSSVSASTVEPPNVQMPDISYTRNLLGDKETDELNQPIKVYVTERDITDAQTKAKVTQSNATF